MFSSLASLFKNKKKSKKNGEISRENSQVSIAKDALEVLGKRYVDSDSERSGVSVESKFQSGSIEECNRFVSERLLQGGSSSTEQNPESDANPDNNKPRLYPDLNSVSDGTESGKEVEDIKSIHDFIEEIDFVIVPKILNAVDARRNLNILKAETSDRIITLQNTLINPTKYDYDFNKEYKVINNSPSSIFQAEYYKKIKDFVDLKIYRQNIDGKLTSFINDRMTKKNSSTKKHIFQSYSKSFKSYRGDKRDLVNCP